MTQRAADYEGRRSIARHLFEALCAQHPDKYIALIKPRDIANELPPEIATASVVQQSSLEIRPAHQPCGSGPRLPTSTERRSN